MTKEILEEAICFLITVWVVFEIKVVLHFFSLNFPNGLSWHWPFISITLHYITCQYFTLHWITLQRDLGVQQCSSCLMAMNQTWFVGEKLNMIFWKFGVFILMIKNFHLFYPQYYICFNSLLGNSIFFSFPFKLHFHRKESN